MDRKYDVLTKNNLGGIALHKAAVNGKSKSAEFLINNGSPVNAQNNNGWTPLHETAIHNHLECSKYLLTRGADKNLADKYEPYADLLFLFKNLTL